LELAAKKIIKSISHALKSACFRLCSTGKKYAVGVKYEGAVLYGKDGLHSILARLFHY
jgi:hypothetical protein